MFDIDDLIVDLRAAVEETEPRRAVREVLDRAVSEPGEVAAAFDPQEGGITLVHHTPELTVLNVVWAPGMELYPHDHRMWAAIAIYEGIEDNAFFRRPSPDARTLVESGGKHLHVGDSIVLGDDVIHSVANPAKRLHGRDPRLRRRLREPAPQPVGAGARGGASLRHRGRLPAVRRRQRRVAGLDELSDARSLRQTDTGTDEGPATLAMWTYLMPSRSTWRSGHRR